MTRLNRVMVALAAAGLLGFMVGDTGAAEGQNPFERSMEDRFNAMDANKDGKISYEEYLAAYQRSIKASFEKRDKNGDGFIAKDEFIPKGSVGMGPAKGNEGGNPFQKMMQQQQPQDKQGQQQTVGEKK
ncbi:MAG: hypothetical protein ABIN58_08500 [candidate division WOR-3 bacterium]